ncbi:MAG: YsnF/AvaK domain-containing protein [Actinobacteria bacterium]|nr:YsnF/AvaK domain-containing protein [Actinomycetota bacterium]
MRGRDEEREGTSLVRSEEELDAGTASEEAGRVRARKRVETEHVEELVPRHIEEADVERTAAGEGDSGEIETLPDGSVSIPILEEELVVTKRTVVRERVVVRKRTLTEEHRVEAELRKEHVDLDTSGEVELEERR